MKEFDIEKLECKNIYKVPDDLSQNIQNNVMKEMKANLQLNIECKPAAEAFF
ncbi:hypothetical protein SAMN05421594_2635 [Chryseobacterium oleae]|uniref:Uncharacterized protein n=1 Tax=Chryseobacterium oleae TaxID=491207 RepID=A0A1I4YRS3_CHROL|nr:hypothetical protein SAMN05421594_2635 [Chryseobacterium oleae]